VNLLYFWYLINPSLPGYLLLRLFYYPDSLEILDIWILNIPALPSTAVESYSLGGIVLGFYHVLFSP